MFEHGESWNIVTVSPHHNQLKGGNAQQFNMLFNSLWWLTWTCAQGEFANLCNPRPTFFQNAETIIGNGYGFLFSSPSSNWTKESLDKHHMNGTKFWIIKLLHIWENKYTNRSWSNNRKIVRCLLKPFTTHETGGKPL